MKIQKLKCKTKLKYFQNKSKYYDEMNIRRRSNTFQFVEIPFSKNAKGFIKFFMKYCC